MKRTFILIAGLILTQLVVATAAPAWSDIKVEVREVSCGWEGCHRNDVDIDVSWFATGVKTMRPGERPAKANLPPLVLGMMPLGRKKRVILEEEDESAELAKQGREEEEKAAEADEGGKE